MLPDREQRGTHLISILVHLPQAVEQPHALAIEPSGGARAAISTRACGDSGETQLVLLLLHVLDRLALLIEGRVRGEDVRCVELQREGMFSGSRRW